MDGRDVVDLPARPSGHLSDKRLRRAQRVPADIRTAAEIEADHPRGASEAGCHATPREEVAALALGCKLVSMARLRSSRHCLAAAGIAPHARVSLRYGQAVHQH